MRDVRVPAAEELIRKAMCGIVAAACLIGADPATAQDVPPAGQAEEEEMPPMQETFSELVTVNVQDGELPQVLNAFARQTGKSIVIGPDVEGQVTMRLNNIPWQDALQVILKPYGYGYEVVGDTIVVSKQERIAAAAAVEPITAEVFRLKYLDAWDVKDVVEAQLSPRGTVSVLTSRGLRGWEFETAEQRAGMTGAGAIGKRRRREEIEERPRSKVLLVADTPAHVRRAAAILEEVDRKPCQVLIEARFVEVDSDKLTDIGVEFGTGATGAEGPPPQAALVSQSGDTYGLAAQQISGTVAPANFAAESSSLNDVSPFNGGLTLMFQKLSGTEFQVLLHMLQETVAANVLSAPRILTLNNQEAAIIVGTKFPIITSEVSGESATVSTTLEYYENIGIQLNVVPQVCDDGMISMIIHPAVTDQIGSTAARTTSGAEGVPLTEYPILSTREAETQIMVRSGETIVMGGLIKEQESKSVIKVPLLGDIPLLGRLFRRDTIDTQKIDLLIFLTATIMTDEDLEREAGLGAARRVE